MQKISSILYIRSCLIALSLGISIVSIFTRLPSLWLVLMVVVLLILLSLRWLTLRIVTCFALGVFWSTFYGHLGLDARLPETMAAQDLQVVGFVQEMPQNTDDGQRFLFTVEKIVSHPSLHLRKLSLSTYNTNLAFHAGDRWQLTARLKPPHGFKNRGGFDYEAWIFEQGIDAVGYVKQGKKIGQSFNFWALINVWREQLRDGINDLIPQSNFKGIITALIIGDGYQISSDQWRVFNRTSTSHLIAISGLHISMIAAFCFAFVCTIGKRLPISHLLLRFPLQKIAAIVALFVTIFYSLLTGMSIPTQRTLVMVVTSMMAIFLNKNIKPSYLLSAALVMVLLFDPLAVISAGFWLSFIAVAVLLFGLLGRVDLNTFVQWGRSQWIIFIGLIPVMGMCLHQLSLIGPIANLLAIPVISFLVTPLCLLGAFLMPLSSTGATYALTGCDFLLTYLWQWLSVLSHYDYASIAIPDVGLVGWILFSIGIGLLMLPHGIVGRYWGFLALIFLLIPYEVVPKNAAKINVLDVGQGLAVVVQTKHHTLVYDTGPRFSDKLDAGAAAVVPYLRYAGVSDIDTLVVSHADNDHSGGLSSVLENMNVNEFITGSPEKIAAQKACSNTQQWQWDGVLFEVLWPIKNEALSEKENNRSCVIKISVGQHALLLTGDIEKPVEQLLVEANYHQLQADLLIAPHHGSKTSSTDAFIKAVKPMEVVFSSGYMSRFGHPHADVVARYERNGVNWRNTADSGGIIYQLSEQGIKCIEEYRRAHPHYWDAP